MSGLAGVRWFDESRRAAVRELAAPLNNLAHRGPDGLYAHASGPCALGIAHFITTPEARAERQPHVTAGGLVVTLDGRIDNTVELRSALSISPIAAPSDVAVVAAAWERWGTETPARLLGDFALAVWDGRERRLFLARDIFGLRPLFYREHGGGLWWGSELQVLARLGDLHVDEGMAAEYLSERVTSEVDTIVRGVRRLPRASVLTLPRARNASTRRYWQPQVDGPDEVRSDAEALEQFRVVFGESVRARVRSDRVAGLMLSGGLDSSLIAAESRCDTYTTRWHTPADESSFAAIAATHLSLQSTIITGEHANLEGYRADASRALDLPEAPNSRVAHPLRRAMRSHGCRVVLNGVGGDEWFTSTPFAVADELRRGRWLRAAARLSERRQNGHPWTSELRLAAWALLPARAKRHVRKALHIRATPPWIRREFAATTELETRLRNESKPSGMPTHHQQQLFAWATNGDAMFFAEHGERIDASYGLEPRSPFYDRRLVEWALSLSARHRRRGRENKWLLRRAAEDMLPPAIAGRGKGADFSFLTSEALHLLGGETYVMDVARRRDAWVVPAAVQELWREMCAAEDSGVRLGHSSWILWLLVAADLAAQAIETYRTRPEESRALVMNESRVTLKPALAQTRG